MKIILNKKVVTISPSRFLRESGYAYIIDRNNGKESYMRHLGRDRYPRFHIYFQDLEDRIIFDLHLDQKKASYEGSHAHSAEYDGDVVETEIERIKNLLRPKTANPTNFQDEQEETKDPLKQMGQGQIDNNPEQKKSWLKKIFKL